jgi:hypothetical protein
MPDLAAPLGAALNVAAQGDVLTWYLENGHIHLDSLNIDVAGDLAITRLISPRPIAETEPSTPAGDGGVKSSLNGDVVMAATHEASSSGKAPTYPPPFGSCLSIATTSSSKMTYAFAIRDADNAVCMISPVYYPLVEAKSKGNGIAACTIIENRQEKTWVFYIGEDEKNSRRFFKFDVSSPEKTLRVRTYEPAQVSQLCVALMNPDGKGLGPYLFYQFDDDGDVGLAYAAVNKTHNEHIAQIGDISTDTTPLAACNFRGSVFLFYLSSTRVVKGIKHGKNGWENSFALLDDGRAIKANPQSGLSAAPDELKDRIVVVYDAPTEATDRKKPCNVHVINHPLSV